MNGGVVGVAAARVSNSIIAARCFTQQLFYSGVRTVELRVMRVKVDLNDPEKDSPNSGCLIRRVLLLN